MLYFYQNCSLGGVLTKLQSDAEDIEAVLKVKKIEEADFDKALEELNDYLLRLRQQISQAGEKTKDDVEQQDVDDMEEMIQQGLIHRQGMDKIVKELKFKLRLK
jgi:cob(I)alamin adenosyltransferase